MPKKFKWWSVVQSALGGAVVVYVGHIGGPWGYAFALGANALVWGIGELLNQSSADLREHSMELVRLSRKEGDDGHV